MEEYNNFKIIGVRPLTGCNPRILKNLIEEEPYFFYNNFKWENNEIIDKGQNLPNDFFSPGINIHAIVGVNGSGKSSVLDLMFRIINNLAFALLNREDRPASEKLSLVKNLNAELYYLKDQKVFTIKEQNDILTWKRPYKKNIVVDLMEIINSQGDDNYIDNVNIIELQDLFYTIVTNYSQYAYNSLEFKHESSTKQCWIDGLFHKNDGYLTPLVFNPYRNKGVIDINSENNLTRSRLTTLFIQQLIQGGNFYGKYELHSFNLSLSKQKATSKYNYIESIWEEKKKYSIPTFKILNDKIIDKWDEIYHFQNKSIHKANSESYSLALKYLVYKTIKITENYPSYKKEFGIDKIIQTKVWVKQSELLNKLIDKLDTENSHITLKIRQTIAFLIYAHYQADNKSISQEEIVKIAKLHSDFRKNKSTGLDYIMNLLPPPIFNTSFYLSYKNENNRIKKVEISSLSSGERQFFYSISSVLYHLSNLESINELDRVKYNSVNLIMEEVELYYHPEYQRQYVSNLLQHLKMLQLKHCININICIITHSPFVLSDIPKENILFLEDGKPSNKPPKNDTFGANIYDLLKESFFLTDNAIGDFASEKINYLIDIINRKELNVNLDKLNKFVELIGEPILRNYLSNKLNNYAKNPMGR